MTFGTGVIRGMGITLRHFLDSYVIGFKEQPSAAGDIPQSAGKMKAGMPTETGGMFTAQYPDEKLPVPERFRAIPFLLYDEDGGEREVFDGIRCTACGICAKVCPPQCIWIVQGKGTDGRPRPVATEFYIDASICMSCGFCAEYCPFDAIKMDHDYEISSYERHESWVYDIQELLHPVEYHAAIHPADYRREVTERLAKEEAQRQKQAAAAVAAASSDVDMEELKRQKAEARRKFLESRGKAAEGGDKSVEGGDTSSGAGPG